MSKEPKENKEITPEVVEKKVTEFLFTGKFRCKAVEAGGNTMCGEEIGVSFQHLTEVECPACKQSYLAQHITKNINGESKHFILVKSKGMADITLTTVVKEIEV